MPAFRHILVTTDFSDAAQAALSVAKDLAERYEARLTILTVYEGGPMLIDGVLPHGRRSSSFSEDAWLEKLRALAEEAGVPDAELAVVTDASPVEGILKHVKAGGIDLVVIATRGRSGLERLLIGSVTERVVRHAPCAVLTVKA
ncbi:MAG TPA: universal stress protein [Polyangiaceae bacterium LLY-WYZ-15_(1-7)]|nr:universal stress protein [Polyangiaceae bacterium LLY-WYZ-15_(1-7)]HJL12697.1 universal stress protein [Polyangiaceae bacterium LLY-WYZ-15_(1-7)]HJL22824.1 universal stress protein [Polyangiaceae bacterium LLY-WYZ-15_(1-7)]HJL27565.1 universal stress protein [Polyangiaceae bacterium LLY-WYZ-15_(1-7)]HJL36850.1 universal stress protein [Polyangiaceae bacterium LLY-WYZ-15_(1-7)]